MRASMLLGLATLAMSTVTDVNMGQYTPWAQPPKGPRNKPGNSLAAARIKAKARRKAQQKARRK